MIRRLGIQSFKAFAALPANVPGIPLQPFTVLVGPNGSGKSTILQAIDMLGWLSNGPLGGMLEAHQWDYSDLRHQRSRVPVGIYSDISLAGVDVHWSLELAAKESDGVHEELIEKGDGDPPSLIVERHGRQVQRWSERTGERGTVAFTTGTASWLSTVDPKSDAADYPTLVALAAWARRIRAYYFLDPVALRAPSREKKSRVDELGLHGENLASFLARIKSRPKDFARLIDRVRAHYPRLVDIHVRRKSFGWTHVEITEKWNGETGKFNARHRRSPKALPRR